jgi:hypothetical protein
MYQIWDIGICHLEPDHDAAWEYIKPDYLIADEIKKLSVAWWDFIVNAPVGDIFRMSREVYVVKLGKDWAP